MHSPSTDGLVISSNGKTATMTKNGKTFYAIIQSPSNAALEKVMQLILDLRAKVKANKDFATSDEIRNKLTEAGIQVKDSKDGASWSI